MVSGSRAASASPIRSRYYRATASRDHRAAPGSNEPRRNRRPCRLHSIAPATAAHQHPAPSTHRNNRQRYSDAHSRPRYRNPGRITRGSAATSSSPRQATAMRNRSAATGGRVRPRRYPRVTLEDIRPGALAQQSPRNFEGGQPFPCRYQFDLLIHDIFFGICTEVRFDAKCAPFPAATEADGGLSDEQQYSLYRNPDAGATPIGTLQLPGSAVRTQSPRPALGRPRSRTTSPKG